MHQNNDWLLLFAVLFCCLFCTFCLGVLVHQRSSCGGEDRGHTKTLKAGDWAWHCRHFAHKLVLMNWIWLLWQQNSRYSCIPSGLVWNFKAYLVTMRLRGKTVRPWVGIPNRESHGQTVSLMVKPWGLEGLSLSLDKFNLIQPNLYGLLVPQ